MLNRKVDILNDTFFFVFSGEMMKLKVMTLDSDYEFSIVRGYQKPTLDGDFFVIPVKAGTTLRTKWSFEGGNENPVTLEYFYLTIVDLDGYEDSKIITLDSQNLPGYRILDDTNVKRYEHWNGEIDFGSSGSNV